MLRAILNAVESQKPRMAVETDVCEDRFTARSAISSVNSFDVRIADIEFYVFIPE